MATSLTTDLCFGHLSPLPDQTDYSFAAAITIDASTPACILIDVTNDNNLEADETFGITISTTEPGAVVLGRFTATVTITEDPADVVTIGFTENTYSVQEGASPDTVVCVELQTGTLQRDAVVTVMSEDGSATGIHVSPRCLLLY